MNIYELPRQQKDCRFERVTPKKKNTEKRREEVIEVFFFPSMEPKKTVMKKKDKNTGEVGGMKFFKARMRSLAED